MAGHSYGGLLALLLAAAHPGQLAGLVLVDPALPALLVAEAILGCARTARPR